MTIKIVYCFPSPAMVQTAERYALRFIESYNLFPPGVSHETIIVLNGWKYSLELECMFSSLQGVQFLEHDNSGYDCGAFQQAAATCECDFMVFFGMSTYFRIENWLLTMATAYLNNGPGLFGVMGNRGVGNIHPHIRTTGFGTSPKYMNQYPVRVVRADQRYLFEHGPDCLTGWFKRKGMKVMVVASNGVYEWANWDKIPGSYHRGAQESLLCGDRLTEPPFTRAP